ncbi:DUF4153 domain-containing protein [Pseudonocardia sp. TRM90224]|uniref:DUF4153 domain-containing protein n=1 Tax=Pseudonocardia sp. TRM90224 TaxID=2812678 RepID=UPI001E551C33|nr:DUF4173 domain-containing protein [Pseudonocardia sp. TRM90224]
MSADEKPEPSTDAEGPAEGSDERPAALEGPAEPVPALAPGGQSVWSAPPMPAAGRLALKVDPSAPPGPPFGPPVGPPSGAAPRHPGLGPAVPYPPPQPLFAWWPRPASPPSRRILGCAAAAGVVAAIAVPEGRAGVGFLVTALVMTVAWLAVGRPQRPTHAALPHLLWGVAAVGLVAVTVVRDAEWLAALCLLMACVAGSLAVAGRSFATVLGGVVAVPIAAMRAVPWTARGLTTLRHGAGGVRVLLSVLAAVVVLVVFVPLLAAADAAFASLVDAVVPTLDLSSAIRWAVLFALAALGVLGACFVLVAPPQRTERAERPTRLQLRDWVIPVGVLVLLFVVFVGVQFAALFGGDEYVRRTTGPSYAEYARSGFGQLVAVTLLTLGVLVLAMRFAPATTAKERRWKRTLLAVLVALTLVIIASALSRMWLYQQAYGFTVLRLLVLTFELWLGLGFLLVLVGVLRLRHAGLARGMLAAGVAALLGLAVLNPEGFIAEHNIARLADSGKVDVGYLSTLSADAVPALQQLPEPHRTCALGTIAQRLPETDDWRSANIARAQAREALAGAAAPNCSDGSR